MTRRTKRKTTIITETDRLLILNRQSGAVEGWCDDLDGLFGMLEPEAAAVTAFRIQAPGRLAQTGKRQREDCPNEAPPDGLAAVLKPA
ncbi:MAG TPA: hypothetical protein VL523_03130 [Terriglobia bacterium]|nr:hypothetical protein [Terriglobia bacterium]